MKLIPYLNFQGTCEEAIDFYLTVFEGEIVYKDYFKNAPMEIPEDYKEKIMHCQLDFGDNTLMACDAFPGVEIKEGNGVDLSIGFDEEVKAEEIFNKLAEGGKITMPFEKQFWGAWLGQLTDSFGKKWMISTNIHA
ncbi:VOC family protein [Dyadobacter subterraneus]|uniref:VOC family protein n=1 Tax=Dyadobacter subterraneus TaxID=2773304 RepID=A0ABR9WM32_9BACT|nr:VOC family protein [Dyadobacter subterraneus]MBE9466587.1 VOC family protein [Dyadobacter subterraneus]